MCGYTNTSTYETQVLRGEEEKVTSRQEGNRSGSKATPTENLITHLPVWNGFLLHCDSWGGWGWFNTFKTVCLWKTNRERKEKNSLCIKSRRERERGREIITTAWDFLHGGLVGGNIYWAVQTGTEQGGENKILIQCHRMRQDFVFVAVSKGTCVSLVTQTQRKLNIHSTFVIE